jgi:hypothetical protein
MPPSLTFSDNYLLLGRWRKSVSTFNRSLAFEEIKESEVKLEELLPVRHLSISSVSTTAQPVHQVVKVSGSITISF